MKKAFYFLLIFSLGAASGWYFADPKNQKLMRNLPKEWQDPAKVSNLLLNSVSNIPRTVMRLYDDKMPQNIKDSLADGLPAVFGHPFVCRIERVFTTNSESGANPRVRVDSSAGTRQLGQKSLIRAGDHFTGSPPKLSVELKCGNLEFVFGPGANVKLIRGEGARKVLVVNGSVNVRASGASKFGFSHPFGEVNVDTRSYANLQVVGSSKINSINVFDGKLLVTWEVGATTKSKKAVLRILNGPNASIRVLRKKGSEEETRVLGPRKQISFLANGKLSGSGKVTKVMTPPSSSGGEGGVALKNMDIVKKTPKGAKKIDVTMNWRIEPVNRNAPCEVDLASDQKFSNILAEYKSDQNALLIKGMKPGIYFWRARCEINGDEEKSKNWTNNCDRFVKK